MKTTERCSTAASADVVWQVLKDVEHWKEWTPTVLEITPLTHAGFRVGASFRVTQPGLKPAVYEVTACNDNQGFTWMQRLPLGGFLADHTITARNGQTEVELSFRSQGLVAAVASALFAKKIRQFVATEAQSLKQKCDSLATP